MSFEVLPPHDVGYAEPDRLADRPHPREVLSLLGHQEAEAEFLDTYRSGRLPHAWLIGGEEGIGKATLAYRIARFVLANPLPQGASVRQATSLHVSNESTIARQIAALAHPDLAIIRRGLNEKGKVMTEISVEAVRKGQEVFNKTAGSGGYRIAIVDACEDLNRSSANALLKTLEEPPEKCLLLLVTHQPRRVLPTIRSRCRLLSLRPLEREQIIAITQAMPKVVLGEDRPEDRLVPDPQPDALHQRAADLAEGSVRRALTLLEPKRLAFNDRMQAALAALPRFDGNEIDAIAEQTAGKTGEEAFIRFCELCEGWLADQLAGRAKVVDALSPLPDLWSRLDEGRREVEIYNLDRRPFVIAMMADLAAAARG